MLGPGDLSQGLKPRASLRVLETVQLKQPMGQVTLGLVATFCCALLVCLVALPFFDIAAGLQS